MLYSIFVVLIINSALDKDEKAYHMSESIYKPETFLGECLDFQAAISEMQDPLAQDELGQEFAALLAGRANYLGEKRSIIGGDEALVSSKVGDASAGEADVPSTGLPTLEFENIVAKGRLGNPEYFRSRKRGGTLAVTLYDATALRLDELSIDIKNGEDELAEDLTLLHNRMPKDRPLQLPILFPVDAINFVMCASRHDPHRHSDHVAQNQYFRQFVPLEWA